MIIRSRAPLRLGLAGGGTDVPPYCDDCGGLVLSASINKYAFANWEMNSGSLTVNSHDFDIIQEIKDLINYDGKLDLIKATLKVMNVKLGEHGGRIELYSDAPVGSGLGTSSAVNVGLIGVLWEGLGLIKDKPLHRLQTRHEIARLAHIAERKELGIAGGYQDQYISAYGGLCLIEKKTGKDEIIVTPFRFHDDAINEMESAIILCDIRQQRMGGSIIQEQIQSYKLGQNVDSLNKMKELVEPIKNAVMRGNAKDFGELLHESWMLKKSTAKGTSNDYIDMLYEKAMKTGGVYGGKVSGAGGGGHMMLVCDPAKKYDVRKALQNFVEYKAFSFEKKGLTVWRP
ncbi:MAG: GHMP kinase [archaeon]